MGISNSYRNSSTNKVKHTIPHYTSHDHSSWPFSCPLPASCSSVICSTARSAGILSGVLLTKSNIGPAAKNINPVVTQLRDQLTLSDVKAHPLTIRSTAKYRSECSSQRQQLDRLLRSTWIISANSRDQNLLAHLNAAPFRTLAVPSVGDDKRR